VKHGLAEEDDAIGGNPVGNIMIDHDERKLGAG
jgi:hypothetical protein